MKLIVNEEELNFLIKEKLLEPVSKREYKLHCVNVAEFS